MPKPPETPEDAQKTLYQYATMWGEHALPPTLTATLVAAQHLQPFQALPMLFPPVFLFTSYLNINGYKTDAAGMTSAWSAGYLLLARRRKAGGIGKKFGMRGMVRGATMALCAVNVVSGGLAYAFGKREDSEGDGE